MATVLEHPAAADDLGPVPALVEPSHGLTPAVADPMLARPPGPARQIATWDEAVTLIRAQSPDYASSYEGVVRARAQRRIALAAILPILNGQGGYTHQFFTETLSLGGASLVTPPPDLLTVGATATWNVLNPRELYAVGTADESIEVATLSFSDRRRTIALSLVGTMLSTLAAENVADLNRVGLRSALERLALTQARQQYGQGTALDVDRAQQDVENARRLIISGDESLTENREALGTALGLPVGVSPPGNLDLENFEAAVSRTCHLNDNIERRTDVLVARGRVTLAERAVRDAELLFSPSVAAASQLAHGSVAVLGPVTTWNVGATLTVPIYDGGARYGAMRDARAALEQARQALTAVRLDAIVRSAQAQRSVGVLRSSREVAKRQRDLAQRIDDRTRSGYAHGIGTSLDLVISAQDLRRSEIDLAILEYQFAQARAEAVLTNAECLY
jgi:outer membrane protein, multidrug efflux system